MNNKINLPEDADCTGCMACVSSCSRHAISIRKNIYGEEFPEIDTTVCIQCRRCLDVCHLNRDFFPKEKSDNIYAAWSTNLDIRTRSASGGIAATLYQYALKNKIHTFGVKLNVNHEAQYCELMSQEDIEACQNSKYVYSQMGDIYGRIKKYLKQGEKVLFIGLPCHVAGVFSYLGKKYDNLISVDIVCHGTCSSQYLKSHIQNIEKKKNKTADMISFRDPQYETNNFIFSLRKQNEIIYVAPVEYTDAYQIGYHKALIYRENCYHCKYARAERISDLTISDFSGLGRIEEWKKEGKSVSCVIASTKKGEQLLDVLKKNRAIEIFKRPSDEAYKFEKQLQKPSVPNIHREKFLQVYVEEQNFDYAVQFACKKEMRYNFIIHILHLKELRLFARKLVPTKIKVVIKSKF